MKFLLRVIYNLFSSLGISILILYANYKIINHYVLELFYVDPTEAFNVDMVVHYILLAYMYYSLQHLMFLMKILSRFYLVFTTLEFFAALLVEIMLELKTDNYILHSIYGVIFVIVSEMFIFIRKVILIINSILFKK